MFEQIHQLKGKRVYEWVDGMEMNGRLYEWVNVRKRAHPPPRACLPVETA